MGAKRHTVARELGTDGRPYKSKPSSRQISLSNDLRITPGLATLVSHGMV